MHTAVFVNNRGFSGKCLPKDLSAIIKATKRKNYNPKLMKAISKRNKEFVKRNSSK